MATTSKKGITAVGILIMLACAPAVRSARFAEYPPKPANYPIRIYTTTEPQCPYIEVGLVTSRQRNRFISMDEVLASLRQRAREMGGDAVIGLAEEVVQRTDEDTDPTLSGTVIRFQEPDCTR